MTPSERYAHRVSHRICVQCAAGLQATDGVRCLECTALDRDHPGKAARDVRHRATPHRKAYQVERATADYQAAAAAKLCADYGCTNPATKYKRCAACRHPTRRR